VYFSFVPYLFLVLFLLGIFDALTLN